MDFEWQERDVGGASIAPRTQERGVQLIESRVPYELGDVGEHKILPGNVRVHIRFPLGPVEGVLDEGNPVRLVL